MLRLFPKKTADLAEVDEPMLYREFFPYDTLPRIEFDDVTVPMNLPKEIWVTDTTFRDGQQAREPYTIDQMVTLYDFMNELGGKKEEEILTM